MKNELIKKLESVGLTHTEAKAYVLLLSNGPLTPQELVDLTNIPRTRIYGILRRLQSDKLIEVIEQNGQKYFSPSPPIVISEKVRADYEKAIKSAENLVQELLKIYQANVNRSAGDSDAIIKVYRSPQKTLELLERVIVDKDISEIWTLQPAEGKKLVHRPLTPRMPPDERISLVSSSGKPVKMRWLVVECKEVKKIIKESFTYRFGGPPEQFEPGYVEIKVIPKDRLPKNNLHFVVMDRKTVMIILREPKPYLSLFVDDPAMAHIYAHFFEEMWNLGVPYEEIP